MESVIVAYLFFSVFLAYGIKGITGFGNTLIMAPLFSFVVSNRITTPIDLLFSLPSNAFIVWRERKHIRWRLVLPLSALLFAGAIPGVFFLKMGEDALLKAVLGLIVMLIGVEMMYRERIRVSLTTSPMAQWMAGLLSGLLSGLYGIAAPIIAFVFRKTNDRHAFRANLCSIFLLDNIFRMIAYGFTGILSGDIVRLTFILAPAVVIGLAVGVRLDSLLKEKSVRQLTISLLLISGFLLFAVNAMAMIRS